MDWCIKDRKKVLCEDGNIGHLWLTPGGIIYRNGYSCRRSYTDKNKNVTYLISNNIFKSSLGKPIFGSIIKLDDTITFRTVNTDPSTVYRTFVENLEIPLKGKLLGHRFCGLLTKDYKDTYDGTV